MKRFRLVVLSAVWLGVAFFSLDRVNISLAAPEIMRELGISGMEMGMVLSLYFWGYLLGNPLGGLVADNFNIRRFATAMLGSWCIFTALTGLCRNISHFYLVRGLFGLAEGAVIGPLNSTYILLFDIFPAEVTGTAIGIVSASGGAASGIVAPLVIGYLLDVTGSFFWGFTLFAFSALLAGIVLLPLIPWEQQIRAEKARKWSVEQKA